MIWNLIYKQVLVMFYMYFSIKFECDVNNYLRFSSSEFITHLSRERSIKHNICQKLFNFVVFMNHINDIMI